MVLAAVLCSLFFVLFPVLGSRSFVPCQPFAPVLSYRSGDEAEEYPSERDQRTGGWCESGGAKAGNGAVEL